MAGEKVILPNPSSLVGGGRGVDYLSRTEGARRDADATLKRGTGWVDGVNDIGDNNQGEVGSRLVTSKMDKDEMDKDE